MTIKDFSSYSQDELLDALKILRSYRAAAKQIGNRAKISDMKRNKKPFFRIEYAPEVGEDFLYNFSDSVIQKYFPEVNSQTEKVFMPNSSLSGGIRVFYGDDMIDISFQDFARTLKGFTF